MAPVRVFARGSLRTVPGAAGMHAAAPMITISRNEEISLAAVLVDGFEHRPGGHCSSTALRDLLSFYGHQFTEEMVFGLGAGLAFVYYRNPLMEPPVYIGGRVSNLEEQLRRSLGFEMEVVKGLDDVSAWLEAKEMLDAGTPVMVHADVYHLDYLNARRHFSGHRVVLVGYDEERGVAFVADNDRDSVQECSLQSLRRARAAAFLPQPAENLLYRFSVPRELTALEEAIPRAIDVVVGNSMRLAEERSRYSRGNGTVVKGIEGLGEFATVMDSWPGSMAEEMLSLQCKSIYVMAEKGGTGYGGNFRRLYGRFLKESAGVLEIPALGELGDEFVRIGDAWTRLSLTFREHSRDGREAVRLAGPLAREILRLEREAYLRLDAEVSSMKAV